MSELGIIGGIILALLYFLAAFYMGWRLFQWTVSIFPRTNKIIFIIVYTILAAMALFALVPMKLFINFSYTLRTVGGYFAGILMYLFMFLVLGEIITTFVAKIRKASKEFSQRIRFQMIAIVMLLTVATTGYGIYNATQITVTTYEVELLRDLEGEMKIVLLSDLHLGEVHSERRLADVVAYINYLQPDIVCIAGDIFNDDFYAIRDPKRAMMLFNSIESTFGVFACLGNHDTGPTIGSMKEFLYDSNVQLLNDDHVIIDNRLVLIGRLDDLPPWQRDDGFGGMERENFSYVMDRIFKDLDSRNLSPHLPIIVMDHNPIHINDYGSEVDLALFGHTHGGGLFPINLVTRMMFVVNHGHFQKDYYSPHIIVTKGVQPWSIPMRIGTNNEIIGIVVR